MMKRITITIDEEMYIRLLDYSLDRSKAELRNVSTSEAVRELLAMQLRRMGKVHAKSGRDFGPKVGEFHPTE
jgi:hypothetical protein